jgi:hypothetical protein
LQLVYIDITSGNIALFFIKHKLIRLFYQIITLDIWNILFPQ